MLWNKKAGKPVEPCICDSCENLKQKSRIPCTNSMSLIVYTCQIYHPIQGKILKCVDYRQGEPKRVVKEGKNVSL